jgi:syntaxin-binding protein 1
VPEEDRKRLFQHAHLAMHEQDMVNNLKFLGLDISKEMKTSRRAPLKQKQLDDVYDISRFQPLIKLMLDVCFFRVLPERQSKLTLQLQEHVVDRLDRSLFPYLRDEPTSSARSSTTSTLSQGAPGSLRSSRPQWAERARTKTVKEPRQRIVVFQLGGMTYSEIRSAYKVSASAHRDVFIGVSEASRPKK